MFKKVFIAFAVLNVVIWSIYFLRHFIVPAKQPNLIQSFTKEVEMPGFKSIVGNEATLSNAELQNGFTILVFFSFGDCSSCLFEAEFWSIAYEALKPDVRVIGILDEDKNRFLKDFRHEYKLSFPILLDKEQSLRDRIVDLVNETEPGLLITPFKVIVFKGRIIYVEGPNKFRKQQQGLYARIQQVIFEMNEPE